MKILRFLISLIKYVFSGLSKTNETVYHARLQTCNKCIYRRKDRCSVCGCFIRIKASWQTEKCPKGYWENGV